MSLPTIYDDSVIQTITERLEAIDKEKPPVWGKMNAAQMLAHLNVMFEIGLNDQAKQPNALVRFILQTFVKNKLINDDPYQKNSKTAPEMVIRHQPDFLQEKERFLSYLDIVHSHGPKFFSTRKHPSFGHLNPHEWSNLFYKHIDHHLTQFEA